MNKAIIYLVKIFCKHQYKYKNIEKDNVNAEGKYACTMWYICSKCGKITHRKFIFKQ